MCQEYQSIVDAEWKILYDKLDKISQSGAKVVLSKLPIGDVATQYFADRWDFCVLSSLLLEWLLVTGSWYQQMKNVCCINVRAVWKYICVIVTSSEC